MIDNETLLGSIGKYLNADTRSSLATSMGLLDDLTIFKDEYWSDDEFMDVARSEKPDAIDAVAASTKLHIEAVKKHEELIKKSNNVFEMTTKFWCVTDNKNQSDTDNIGMVCCRVDQTKSRIGNPEKDLILIIGLDISVDKYEPKHMTYHKIEKLTELGDRYTLGDMVFDRENDRIVEIFNSYNYSHHKYLFIPGINKK